MEIREYNNDNKGCLWVKEKNGKKYMSGYIISKGERLNITIFKNDYKTKEKHPEFNIKVNLYDEELTTGGGDPYTILQL